MKSYPSISKDFPKGKSVYAFDKLDGSNIRAEWTSKRGFFKFGTRHRLVDDSDPVFGKTPLLIQEKYAEDLSRIFRENRWKKAICFFEYWGKNSFAGSHDPNDEHTVTLFDVAHDKKGILEPLDFLNLFDSVDHAPLLYHGKVSHEFVRLVQESELEGMTFEGVVCKGKHVKPGLPLMFKVKSHAWLAQLKSNCGDNDKLFQKLC